ncbi:hypothetical protein [Flagellimonas myxillae]|uniref:hypothetical protein n=1 Tax=Flagellimonas myxillae TaxID=2942214 RepID=UPI00201ECE8E|nr:hypothetical protein [Muricauda myxillae]MCL6265896.1 hypothetical protein [Muricauda myxillae]
MPLKTNVKLLCFLMLSLCTLGSYAQDQRFIGTFISMDQTFSAQTKYVDGEYQGVLNAGGAMFAYKGKLVDGVIRGELFGGDRIFNYVSKAVEGGISVESEGNTVMYYQTAQTHQLDQLDLTPYFTIQSQPSQVSTPENSPKATGKYAKLFNMIAGSQLVYYQRTSYVNNNKASSLTYVNFCPNGTFNMNSEGSYTVQGGAGGNVHGANRGGDYGTWNVEEQQGVPVLAVRFANGQATSYPINMAHLNEGRWRIGNTQYAIQRNGAVCR